MGRPNLKNNDIRKLLVNKGYENVKRFSWQKVALKTLKVYEKIYGNVKKTDKSIDNCLAQKHFKKNIQIKKRT